MTGHLSISRAWDETKARVVADGRLLTTVALAFIALPSGVAEFIAPSGYSGTPRSPASVLVLIVVALIGIVGQLALVRLSYPPSVTVGEAIGHALRRALPYLGAAILIVCAIVLLMVPFIAILALTGNAWQPGTPPNGTVVLLMILFTIIAFYFAVRFMLSAPVASAEAVGPIGILKRSWRLTDDSVWRLVGFVLLFLVGAIIGLGAVNVFIGIVARLLFGGVDPMSIGLLLVVLVNALASALATTVFAVMITRIYVQLSGDRGSEVSVPSSGT